jgi:hypothetical protein
MLSTVTISFAISTASVAALSQAINKSAQASHASFIASTPAPTTLFVASNALLIHDPIFSIHVCGFSSLSEYSSNSIKLIVI